MFLANNLPLLFILLILVAGCTQNIPLSKNTAEAEPNTVVIKNFAFKPIKLRVAPGTTVSWINEDKAPHTVTAENLFDSGQLAQNQGWSYKFKKAGIYRYYCSFHLQMRGEIIVE